VVSVIFLQTKAADAADQGYICVTVMDSGCSSGNVIIMFVLGFVTPCTEVKFCYSWMWTSPDWL
jgi:hypothetical protein